MTDSPLDQTVRSVVIDRAIRRGCVRALRPNPWLVLVVVVVAAAAIYALLPLGGLTWTARALVGAVVGALAAPATLWLQGRDAARALPLGARFTTSLSADSIRHGIEGREVEHLWSQLLLPHVSRGHVLLVSLLGPTRRFCIPPALLHDGDAERIADLIRASHLARRGRPEPASTSEPAPTPAPEPTAAPTPEPTLTPEDASEPASAAPLTPGPHPSDEALGSPARPPVVVDRALAHQMAADAATALARYRTPLLMALLVLAVGVAVAVAGDLPRPWVWVSVAFAAAVAIRGISPVLARRRYLLRIRPPGDGDYSVTVSALPDGCVVAIEGRETPVPWSALEWIRTHGSAAVLLGRTGRPVILPLAAFPAGLVAEGQRAILAEDKDAQPPT